MKSLSLLTVLSIAVVTEANGNGPWNDHGPLQTSKNGHYISHTDNTPFLWLGDTGWGMIQQLTRQEVDLYLDNRQALGFSVIQSVAHWSPHGGGLVRSADNAPNAYGHRPFLGSEAEPDTSQPQLVAGGTAEQPNDYWDHLDYIVDAVKQRGMYLALLPTWADALITTNRRYTRESAKQYGEFLGKRYGEQPHIIWVLGGDTKAAINGYNKHQMKLDYDYRGVYRAMAEGIAFGATGEALKWDTPAPMWDEVFITYHPNGDYPYGSSQWFHDEPWLDANGVEVWKEVDDVYRTMLDDYQRKDPIKPSLFLEGSYEYGTYRHHCGFITPLRVRRQLYHTFFAGGAGHTYGAAPVWAMRGFEGDYNCGYTWQQALVFPGAYQVATIARQFLDAHQWHTWQPDGRIIEAASQGEGLKAAVLNNDESLALVYFSNNSATHVTNVMSTAAEAYWFNPQSGIYQSIDAFEASEVRLLQPPLKWEDGILVLRHLR